MSTLSTANIESKSANTPPVIKDLNGTEVSRTIRAWCRYNSSGVIVESFNVSSLTDIGTGRQDVNFTNAFSDSNYLAISGLENNVAEWWCSNFSTTSVRCNSYTGSAYTDQAVNVIVVS